MLNRVTVGLVALLGALALQAPAPSFAEDVVRGQQLMTPQERQEQQAEMRKAKTPEERQALRAKQHEKMEQRAKEQGKTLQHQTAPGPGAPGMGRGPGPR